MVNSKPSIPDYRTEPLTLDRIKSRLYVPETTTRNFRILKGSTYDHIPEIKYEFNEWYDNDCTVNTNNISRLQIDVVKTYQYDHRRFWRVGVVILDEETVMVFQNAGREGDDYSSSYIFDKSLYRKLLKYINVRCSLNLDVSVDRTDTSSAIAEDADLKEFYGENIFGPLRYLY